MKTKEQALDQVKKLLTLSKDQGATEDEAIQAALMAQKLMVKYGIEMAETEQEAALDIIHVGLDHPGNAKFGVSLAHLIARAFRCEVFQQNKRRYFMGYSQDAKIAKSVFEFIYSYMLRRIKTLECSAWRKTGSTTGVRNSYAQGFLAGLKTAIDAQSKELMVIVPKEVKSQFAEYTAGWVKKTHSLSAARFQPEYYEAGKKEGSEIMARRQIPEA